MTYIVRDENPWTDTPRALVALREKGKPASGFPAFFETKDEALGRSFASGHFGPTSSVYADGSRVGYALDGAWNYDLDRHEVAR